MTSSDHSLNLYWLSPGVSLRFEAGGHIGLTPGESGGMLPQKSLKLLSCRDVFSCILKPKEKSHHFLVNLDLISISTRNKFIKVTQKSAWHLGLFSAGGTLARKKKNRQSTVIFPGPP